MPEVSLLLAVVAMVISLFGVISHSDGSCIDLSVESLFYIVPNLCSIIIIDILWDVVLLAWISIVGSTCAAWIVMLGLLLLSCQQ